MTPDEIATLAGVETTAGPDPDVMAGLDPNKAGNPSGTVRNVVHVLTHEHRWEGRLKWNEFEETVVLDGRPLEDDGLTEVVLALDAAYKLRPGIDVLLRAVQHVAQRHRFHPVRDWLSGLRWDGTDRLAQFPTCRLGAAGSDLVGECGRCWFIGAVARVFEPGCKMDTMLVLVGPQGGGKSKACEALVPDREWYGDTNLELGSKDAYQQLQGRWIYEFSEMRSLRAARAEAVKAFLTSRVDRFRPPYARMPRSQPRQVVFIGTTNDDQFLDDPTGSRRFWPIRVGRIDVPGIAADREQLWAEAVARYRRREPSWLSQRAEAELRAASQRFHSVDPWTELVLDWAATQEGPFSSVDVHGALGLGPAQMTRSTQTRVGRILAAAGYAKARPRTAEGRVWVWVRG